MSASGFDQVVKTHVGCRRKLNEDAVLACPDRRIWAVADGMGGHEAGEVASAMVVEALSRCLPDSPGHYGARDALASLQDVNTRLIEMGRSGFESRTIGSTVVGLVADGDAFTCFWAGDSRAYQVRDGGMTRLTRDHSLVQDLLDAGMIDEAEAEAHPDSNIITRAVGAADRLQPETVAGDVRSGDLFLLASDGLTRVIGDDELLIGLQGDDLEASADRLIRLALARGAPDNVSLIIVRAISRATESGASRMILQHGHNRQKE
jgi:serine/threonine-protein phosphatase Stp1